MAYPKVILIGGAPLSGKTSLARKLAGKLEYCCISTDDAVQAVRAVTTPETHPGFHVMAGQDYREYYLNRSLDDLISDAQQQHQTTWPAIEELIRVHAMWSAPAIIEGWGLQPEQVARLDFPMVQSLWLVVDETALECRIRQAKDFLQGASDVERLIRQFLGRAIWFNRNIRQTATELGMPILQLPAEATLNEVTTLAMSALQDN